jgi:hypothetical protein
VVTEENPEGALETITLGGCAVGALLNPESNVQGKDKASRYNLALRIQGRETDELELKVAEVSLIQKLIGKSFNALMVGQCWEMLEGEKERKASKKEPAAPAAPETKKEPAGVAS